MRKEHESETEKDKKKREENRRFFSILTRMRENC